MSEPTTEEKVSEAERAALKLAQQSEADRNAALESIADAIEAHSDEILDANEEDVDEAETLLEEGEYTQALVDRLALSHSKIESIAEMVRSVAGQDDPPRRDARSPSTRRRPRTVQTIRPDWRHRNGLRVPTRRTGSDRRTQPQIGQRGHSEGWQRGQQIEPCPLRIIEEATSDLPTGWAQLIEARADVNALLEMDDSVDLLMPRGSSEFVSYIQDNTSIPVLGHTEGVCHVYVDEAADLEMAVEVAHDAKVQYPAACNATETLLIHESVAAEFLPEITEHYEESGVEMRGDGRVREIVDMDAATDEDWSAEYGDLEISLKIVDSMIDAVDHINEYGSKHTDSIITADADTASVFMQGIDSASVFHNASTRFSDGYRYGLGAEVGISTGKTHARGPVGLGGLTTYQYFIEGDGQIVASYSGANPRAFVHEEFDGEWTPGRLSETTVTH